MDPDREQQLFQALADPLRRRLLRLLAWRGHCVGDLVSILAVPQPTASRHLARLRAAGLVTATQQGLWSFYALADPADELQRRLLDSLAAAAEVSVSHQEDVRRSRELLASGGGCCPHEAPQTPCDGRALTTGSTPSASHC